MVNLLQENPEISVDHELVQNSIFYKAVQHATELDISDLNHFEFNGAGDYALNMEFLILMSMSIKSVPLIRIKSVPLEIKKLSHITLRFFNFLVKIQI